VGYLSDISVPHRRLYAGTQGDLSRGSESRQMAWRVKAEDFETFWAEIQSMPETFGTPPGDYTLGVPLRCPDKPSLIASNARYEAMGVGEDGYSDMIVTVTFSTSDIDFTGESLASRRLRFAGNYMPLPGRAFRFTDGTFLGRDFARFVPEQEISYMRHKVAVVPESLLMDLNGKINHAVFLGRPAGTVLFAGADTDTESRMLGAAENQVQLAFMYRPIPWNYEMHPVTGIWGMVFGPDGMPVYQSANLNPLLG
jgi:hypothetical protein